MKQELDKATPQEELALIGFRIDPNAERPQFYTILIHRKDKWCSLKIKGRIAFFESHPLLYKKVWLRSSTIPKRLRNQENFPKKISLTCDLADTFYLIESQDIDESATIINCLNTLSDLLPATGLSLPNEFKVILRKLADHLTFHRDSGRFLNQNKISRPMIITHRSVI